MGWCEFTAFMIRRLLPALLLLLSAPAHAETRVLLFVLGHAIFALLAGSNLFPLGLIFTAPVALLYLFVLMVLRRRPRFA